MPIEQVVALLIAERDRLNRAIEALQGPIRRRGRPPKNPHQFPPPMNPQKVVRRKARTAAQRKAHSLKMKAYWAKRRKQAA